MTWRGASDSNEIDNSDDLTSEIVGIREYNFSVPRKKQFLPWHKPRKQFVRHEQWRYFIAQLVDELSISDRTLTYFGLPGVDLLDLRFLCATVCEPRDLKLRFLGFNRSADRQGNDQTELNISLDEVSKSPSFDPLSGILPDDVRELINEDSIAWRKTFEIGPYDIINLDLCDGFGAQAPGKFDDTYYNMVSKLLAVQARRKSPWLLLLTTRVGRAHIHRDTLDLLIKLYSHNLSSCASFQESSATKYKLGDTAALEKAKLKEKGVQPIFLIGLCKWLLGLAVSQNPPSAMEVKSVLGYRVKPQAEIEDMVSIAIRFDPTHGPIYDSSKLASMRSEDLNECELATKALHKVSSLLDVDEYLESEKEIKAEMVDAMCDLLSAARYDVEEYRRYIADRN